jgi:hypothetical protein
MLPPATLANVSRCTRTIIRCSCEFSYLCDDKARSTRSHPLSFVSSICLTMILYIYNFYLERCERLSGCLQRDEKRQLKHTMFHGAEWLF